MPCQDQCNIVDPLHAEPDDHLLKPSLDTVAIGFVGAMMMIMKKKTTISKHPGRPEPRTTPHHRRAEGLRADPNPEPHHTTGRGVGVPTIGGGRGEGRPNRDHIYEHKTL